MRIDDYEQIAKTLKVLRLHRVRYLATFVGVLVLLLAVGYWLWGEIDGEIIIAGFVVGVILAFFIITSKFSKKYKELFIEKFVESCSVPLTYSSDGYYSNELVEYLPLWVTFPSSYGSTVTYAARAEDRFTMEIDGHECNFQEVDMKREEKEGDTTTTWPLFRGVLLEMPDIFKLGFRLVVYSPDCPMTNEGSGMPEVELEGHELLPGMEDHKFASDQPEACAAYLRQNVELMQRISGVKEIIKENLGDEHYAIVFESQVTDVFVLSPYNRFEAYLFKDVKYANVDDDYNSIKCMVDIAKVMLA